MVQLGVAARDALFAAVDAAQVADPLAPVTVTVPSTYAGLHLRRVLAGRGRGSVNVHFLTLARVAELLAAPALARAGRTPRDHRRERIAIELALASAPGHFAAFGAHPTVLDSLGSAMRELDSVSDGMLNGAEAGSVAADVLALHERYREALRDTYSDEDLLRSAADLLATHADPVPPQLDELGTVIVFVPSELSRAEIPFVTALRHRRPTTSVILGGTGDTTIDAGTNGLAARLGAENPAPEDPAPAPEPGPAASIRPAARVSGIVAPDPDEEVRTVIRRIRALTDSALDPVPAAEIAIVYATNEPYARLLHHHLTAATLPYSAPSVQHLADSTTGRVLLDLLALQDHGFRRNEVLDLVSAAPVLDPETQRHAPATRWDALSRRAGVAGGIEQWHQRLEHYAERAESEAADGRAAEARRLDRFVAALGTTTEDPVNRSWHGWSGWATQLLDRYLGRPGPAWPDVEVEAHGRILERLEALAELDDFVRAANGATAASDVPRTTFRDVARGELDAIVGHTGKVGGGVFVGSLPTLRGCTFRAVFVLGVADGRLPGGVQPDPLLPDPLRVRLGLPRTTASVDRARVAFLGALRAATEDVVLSYPRSDPRAAQSLLPSPWFDEFVTPTDFEFIASFAGGVERGPAASGSDLRRQELTRWRAGGEPVVAHPMVAEGTAAARGLRRGFVAIERRRSDLLTEFDGGIAPIGAGTKDPFGEDRRQSATRLENFATCPFRYFLASVLRLEALHAPEEAESIDPRERGNVIHLILESFFRSRGHDIPGPGERWTSEDHEQLQAVATDVFHDWEQEGRVGRASLWKFEQRRVRRELDALLDTDAEIRSARGCTPIMYEVGFGTDEAGALPPVVIDLDPVTSFSFRGRIDRIDRSEGGDLVVFDYKTGRQKETKLSKSRVDGGKRLQLAIYGRAVRALGATARVDAAYWYTRRRSPADALVEIPVDSVTDERLDAALGHIAGAVRNGTFPMVPGDVDRNTFEHCRSCDFSRVCPADRARAWERKQHDPNLAPIRALEALSTDASVTGTGHPSS